MAAHTYWRLHCRNPSATYVELMEVSFLDNLRNKTTTGGTASASSEYSGSYVAANAFDNTTSGWSTAAGGAATAWVQYQHASPVDVVAVLLKGNATYYPTELALSYSDDGTSWSAESPLALVSGGPIASTTEAFLAPTASRYWRLVMFETYEGGDLELSEIHLFDKDGRADGSVTYTCTHAPDSGSLANLTDGSFATGARFSASKISKPGFAINIDLGSEKVLTSVRFGGPTPSRYPVACLLELPVGTLYIPHYNMRALRWPGASAVSAADPVWNPADKSSLLTITDGRKLTQNANGFALARSTQSITSGRCYVEITISDVWALSVGVANASTSLSVSPGQTGSDALVTRSTAVYCNGTFLGSGVAANGIMRMLIDADARTVQFFSTTNAYGPFTIPWSGAIYLVAGVHVASAVSGYVELAACQAAPTTTPAINSYTAFADIVDGVYPPTKMTPIAADFVFDAAYGGIGYVYGTTKVDDSPDIPVRKRVRLIRQRDFVSVWEMWSDPATGEWRFDWINHTEKYIAVSLDHTGEFEAVIAADITPEVHTWPALI